MNNVPVTMKRNPERSPRLAAALLLLAGLALAPLLAAGQTPHAQKPSAASAAEKPPAAQPARPVAVAPPAEAPDWVSAIIPVRNPEVLRNLAGTLQVFRAEVNPNPALRVVAVRGSKETVQAIREAIASLEAMPRPAGDVEVRGWILQATDKPAPSAGLPAEIAEVAEQLKQTFHFQGVVLLETLLLRGHDDDDCRLSGNVPPMAAGLPSGEYSFRFLPQVQPDGDVAAVTLNNLSLGMKVALPAPEKSGLPHINREIGFSTNIRLKEGEKAIVGKTNLDGSCDALVLVLTARLVP